MLDIKHLENKPIEQADTLPADWYTLPSVHLLDRSAILAKSWIHVVRADQVEQSGQYACADVAGKPLLVVRGKDGVLRGFYNVCRHRAGPIALEDGCANMLQCKYHGWTYTLDGMLRGVPDWNHVDLFDKKEFGLIPVEVAEWEGMVFARLETGGPALSSVVSGISEHIDPIALESLKFARRTRYRARCNWKVYVENYLEAYHVPHVHPELFKLYQFADYTTDAFDWYSLQESPLTEEDNIYARGTGRAYYYHIWPNLMLNILPNRLQTNLVVPISENECEIVFDYFYSDIESGHGRALIEADLKFSDEVQREDIGICEAVQRGLESGVYETGRLSVKRENALWAFQNLVRDAYRTAVESGQ